MDEELTSAVYNGNLEAFGPLYERYKNSIYTYAMYLSYGNVELAHDITSASFLAFFEYCRTHKIQRAKSCLYQITHNIGVTYTQREHRSIRLEENCLEIYEDTSARPPLQHTMVKDILHGAIMHLKAEYIEVIYLYYFDEYSYKEISEIIGKNKNTVGTLIKRARKSLQTYLYAHGYTLFTLV